MRVLSKKDDRDVDLQLLEERRWEDELAGEDPAEIRAALRMIRTMIDAIDRNLELGIGVLARIEKKLEAAR